MRRSGSTRILGTAGKLSAFVGVSLLCAVVVVNTLVRPVPGNTTEYSAVFRDATGLHAGADVLMGGVRVGKVTRVALTENTAKVTFEVRATKRIPADVRVAIRYADMLGARTVNMLAGPSGRTPGRQPRRALAPGAVVPVERTTPALDMTDLLGGFKPLFDALSPDEVNALAGELIAVFQGQSSTVRSLLERTISVTRDLASRKDIISRVLRNVNSLVDVTLRHRKDISELIGGLNKLVTGLARDRERIAGALDDGAELAGSLTDMVERIRPELAPLLASASSASGALVRNTDKFSEAAQLAPELLDNLNRTLDYGSWVNIYVCNLRLDTGPLGRWDLTGGPHSEVCR